MRLRRGAAIRTAVRRVIAFDRFIDLCVVARRLFSTCHQLVGNRHGKRDSGGTNTATATHVRLAASPHASPDSCAGTRRIRAVASASPAARPSCHVESDRTALNASSVLASKGGARVECTDISANYRK